LLANTRLHSVTDGQAKFAKNILEQSIADAFIDAGKGLLQGVFGLLLIFRII
jgi:hypothetical protein